MNPIAYILGGIIIVLLLGKMTVIRRRKGSPYVIVPGEHEAQVYAHIDPKGNLTIMERTRWEREAALWEARKKV